MIRCRPIKRRVQGQCEYMALNYFRYTISMLWYKLSGGLEWMDRRVNFVHWVMAYVYP